MCSILFLNLEIPVAQMSIYKVLYMEFTVEHFGQSWRTIQKSREVTKTNAEIRHSLKIVRDFKTSRGISNKCVLDLPSPLRNKH